MFHEVFGEHDKELTALSPSTSFKVFAPPEGKLSVWSFKFSADEDQGCCSDSVWIRGSILSSLTDVFFFTVVASTELAFAD